jgi:DNA-binding NtrC family response regulator
MRELDADIQLAERADTSVLITGDRTAAADDLARLVHGQSRRRDRACVTLRCAGIDDARLQEDLSTAALEANGGSLLVDDVAETSRAFQEHLLRFLNEAAVRRPGVAPQPVDVRLFATSAEPLFDRVATGAFLEDLYYRLNVIHIAVRPLRGAREEIPSLVNRLLRHISTGQRVTMPRIAPAAMESLKAYDWPGNIRELRSVLESVLVMRSGAVIEANDLPPVIAGPRN